MPLTVATFNVKNLLFPTNEAERALLPAKLDWIAAKLSDCDADVFGLQEVGPEALVQELCARLRSGYAPPVVGTPDARGIRCALWSRLPLARATVHTARALTFPTFGSGDPPPFGDRIPLLRGVVQARVEAPGLGPIDVFVAHLKSPRPMPAYDADGTALAPKTARERAEGEWRSLVWRGAEALHVRGLVDAVMAENASAQVIALGDLNDTPDSAVLRTIASSGDGALFDCTVRADARARRSLVHDGRGVQVDHVLASAALFAQVAEVRFLNDALREHPPLMDGMDETPSIDSDHAPVVVRFAQGD